jgi:FkbM family methyltransferase
MNIAILKGALVKLTSGFKSERKVISWLTNKIIKHQPYGKFNSFNYRGTPIHYFSPGEFLHAAEEIFEKEIYKIAFQTPTPLIIDCGANIGISVLYFKALAPQAKIIAYEPDTANFELLQKNTQHLKNVQNVKAAVWINEHDLQFEDVGAQGSKISTGNTAHGISLKIVKAVRLRTLLQNEAVDLLKIDIEGAEYEVIKDCKDALSNVKNIFLEYHGTFNKQQQLLELLQIVNDAGFDYYIDSANETFKHPFLKQKGDLVYDQQLNIFCTRKPG